MLLSAGHQGVRVGALPGWTSGGEATRAELLELLELLVEHGVLVDAQAASVGGSDGAPNRAMPSTLPVEEMVEPRQENQGGVSKATKPKTKRKRKGAVYG